MENPYQSPEVENTVVHDDRFTNCPRCESVMEAGFAEASTGFFSVESMGSIANTLSDSTKSPF